MTNYTEAAWFAHPVEWTQSYPPATDPRVRAAFREVDAKMVSGLNNVLGTESAMRHEKSGVDGNAVFQVVDNA